MYDQRVQLNKTFLTNTMRTAHSRISAYEANLPIKEAALFTLHIIARSTRYIAANLPF